MDSQTAGSTPKSQIKFTKDQKLNCFSDVAGFDTIASAQPATVITFLNTLDTLFDFLVNQNQVYMVETVGDGYLVVAGCPTKMTNHAQRICDMAFDVMDAIR